MIFRGALNCTLTSFTSFQTSDFSASCSANAPVIGRCVIRYLPDYLIRSSINATAPQRPLSSPNAAGTMGTSDPSAAIDAPIDDQATANTRANGDIDSHCYTACRAPARLT